MMRISIFLVFSLILFCLPNGNSAEEDATLRVFIFAGQSNMVGSDSKVRDIKNFPPFLGIENVQKNIKFSYLIGRENKTASNGWVGLQPVNNIVGPELSFAREVSQAIKDPIAIIKCAAGGTHLGGDWNPDKPIGFKMYPLALKLIRDSLAGLDRNGIRYRIEGFIWHQGENDMFEENYMPNYGKNLKNFIAKWRRDLSSPKLKFYIGELCTKTIWGMDLRPRMYSISQGQREVTEADPLAEYIPTSHIGVEVGEPVGLHYHYGTLGQLQHGINYADSYLRTVGRKQNRVRNLKKWPYKKGEKVNLFILAGHRNMEGERAFIQDAVKLGESDLLKDNPNIAYRYSLGGGYLKSTDWEPLGQVSFYDTFGPELSFAQSLKSKNIPNVSIAKFAHSGSQIIDWTPEGSMAKSRHIYPDFIRFVEETVSDLKTKGHQVRLAGIFYHLSENDMSFYPYRKMAAERIQAIIANSRTDLGMPDLKWYISQQLPTDEKGVNRIDVVADFEKIAKIDPNLIHLKAFNLPPQKKKLVLNAAGVIQLGRLMGDGIFK
tara:strand:- start:2079 stop:3719 length:1641 start_codon:yes stop_codon:yes gene_type:complete